MGGGNIILAVPSKGRLKDPTPRSVRPGWAGNPE